MSEDTDFNLRCLIAGKRCPNVPNALVMHKFRASIDRAPVSEMTRLAIRNEAIVVSKDMTSFVLAMAPVLWTYRHLRQTLPLRPSKWHLIPMLLRMAPARLAAEREGLRIGWEKRERVWRLQKVGWLEILRWLVRGSGPA